MSNGLGLTVDEMRHMSRAAQRYQFAATQDKHPAVAFLHNAYAVAIMDSLRDLASDEFVMRTTGENPATLRSEARKFQDKLELSARSLAKKSGLGEGEAPFHRTLWGNVLIGGAFTGLATWLIGGRPLTGVLVGAGMGAAKHMLVNGFEGRPATAPHVPEAAKLPELVPPTGRLPGILIS